MDNEVRGSVMDRKRRCEKDDGGGRWISNDDGLRVQSGEWRMCGGGRSRRYVRHANGCTGDEQKMDAERNVLDWTERAVWGGSGRG